MRYIIYMNDIDILDLDGQLLRTLLAIYEQGSVTRAAHQLEISQSTLSHRLDRLRKRIGDPLFVRAGRGIVPTERTERVIPYANAALRSLKRMAEPDEFEPAQIDDTFAIAASDYERSILLLDAYKSCARQAPKLKLRFVWERFDNSSALRAQTIDLAVSPVAGLHEPDIWRRPIFRDEIVCFYDPEFSDAPSSVEAYTRAPHVKVQFWDADISFVDQSMVMEGIQRRVDIIMPSISELPGLMKGTALLATVPKRLSTSIMRDFAWCPLPFETSPLTYNLLWHERTHRSAKHAWLREQILEVSADLGD